MYLLILQTANCVDEFDVVSVGVMTKKEWENLNQAAKIMDQFTSGFEIVVGSNEFLWYNNYSNALKEVKTLEISRKTYLELKEKIKNGYHGIFIPEWVKEFILMDLESYKFNEDQRNTIIEMLQ